MVGLCDSCQVEVVAKHARNEVSLVIGQLVEHLAQALLQNACCFLHTDAA